MSDSRPGKPRDEVRWAQNLPLRMPRNERELFLLLSHFHADLGLDNLLGRVDFANATAAQIVGVTLGEPIDDTASWSRLEFDPIELLRESLLSQRFRKSILSRFLNAFPELGRDVFIHVPKCAGTDLIRNVVEKRISIPKLLEFRNWLNDDDFLSVIGGLAAAAPFHDRVFVYGHMELAEYVVRAGTRPGDRMFSIIRDPLELMVSQANYAIGRLCQDPTGRDPDSAEILRILGLPRLPESITDSALKDLAVRALINPQISAKNRACTFLGRGDPGLYKDAIRNLVSNDVEITTTRHYDDWLRERWGIARSNRHNRSDTFLSRREVDRFYREAMGGAVSEDQKLFDVVSWALEKSGTSSVTGRTIAGLAGERSLEDLPAVLGRESRHTVEALSGLNLVVAEEPKHVARYNYFSPVVVPDSRTVAVELELGFGTGQAGLQYLVQGWSGPEPSFTWTNSSESSLRLPPTPSSGTCIVRVIGHPYVARGALLNQRVEILANNIPVGEARLRDLAVIEFEVPAHATADGLPLVLTFRLPMAAVPRVVNGANDDRLLAFALHSLVVLHLQPLARAVTPSMAAE